MNGYAEKSVAESTHPLYLLAAKTSETYVAPQTQILFRTLLKGLQLQSHKVLLLDTSVWDVGWVLYGVTGTVCMLSLLCGVKVIRCQAVDWVRSRVGT